MVLILANRNDGHLLWVTDYVVSSVFLMIGPLEHDIILANELKLAAVASWIAGQQENHESLRFTNQPGWTGTEKFERPGIGRHLDLALRRGIRWYFRQGLYPHEMPTISLMKIWGNHIS